MNLRITQSLLCACLFCFSQISNSALVDLYERDWVTEGDNLILYDASTGLEWLDIGATREMAFGEAESTSWFQEWSYATESQLVDLFSNVLEINYSLYDPAYPEYGYFHGTSSSQEVRDNAILFSNMMGGWEYETTNYYPWGTEIVTQYTVTGASRNTPHYSCPGEATLTGLFVQETEVNAQFSSQCWYLGSDNYSVGSWLVRESISTVPLPPALYLFGTGLLALFGISKRKSS